MVSAAVSTAPNVVGITGNIISLFSLFSPVPTFIGIVKTGSVEQYSPAPYLATLINSMVWLLYGLPMVHPDSILVITINGSGIGVVLVYITIYLIYSDSKKRLKVLLAVVFELIFVAIMALLVMTLIHTTKQRSLGVGIVCILFNVMMYASPLSVMKLVIQTKSVEYMPFFPSLANLASGVTWTIYAFLPFDQFMAIPNGLGILLSLVQLTLYAVYYKSTKRQIAERQAHGARSLSDVDVTGEAINIGSALQSGRASESYGT